MNPPSKKKILIADNIPDALETWVSFFASEGYEAFPAGSPAEVEHILETENVHLAVLDIRLVDNEDEEDFSGIRLAQKPEYAPLPCIVLTGFPNVKSTKLALKKHLGHVPAVDYLTKKDGLDALLEAVETAFTEHVRIHWDLHIDFRPASLLNMLALGSRLCPQVAPRILLNRAEELEDLLRKVFFDYDTLRIERLLWQRPGLLALAVIAFKQGKASETFVLVAGSREAARAEANRFSEFTPGPGNGCMTSLKTPTRESLHFGVNLYQLSDATQEPLYTLEEKYNQEPWGVFKGTLETLLESGLAAWNERREVPPEGETLDDLYRQDLLGDAAEWEQALEERLQVIFRRSSVLDGHFERSRGEITLWLGDRCLPLVDPVVVLNRGIKIDLAVARVHAPGDLRGDNILVQEGGRVWLTDFSHAGLKPYLWNYQSLEAAVRYDWKKAEKLSQIYGMEEALVGSKFHSFSVPDYSLIDAELQPRLRAVQVVRRAAEHMRGFREPAYHLGLFYLAVGRLLSWQPDGTMTDHEISRLAHCLVSAALLARKLQDWTPAYPVKPGLRIDPAAQLVYANGVERPVRGKGLEILLYLYERRPGVVLYDDLIRDVYGFKPDNNARGMVRKAVQRLREDIEPDPNAPVFLLAVQGKGYRLDLNES